MVDFPAIAMCFFLNADLPRPTKRPRNVGILSEERCNCADAGGVVPWNLERANEEGGVDLVAAWTAEKMMFFFFFVFCFFGAVEV